MIFNLSGESCLLSKGRGGLYFFSLETAKSKWVSSSHSMSELCSTSDIEYLGLIQTIFPHLFGRKPLSPPANYNLGDIIIPEGHGPYFFAEYFLNDWALIGFEGNRWTDDKIPPNPRSSFSLFNDRDHFYVGSIFDFLDLINRVRNRIW